MNQDTATEKKRLDAATCFGCPRCRGKVRTFMELAHFRTRKTELLGWGAECRTVLGCDIARKGIIGRGLTRPEAIKDFTAKASQKQMIHPKKFAIILQ